MPDAPSSGLHEYLAERDAPCPGCGYNLRGLSADTCPECGVPLHLSVAMNESWIGRLLSAVVPLAAAAMAAGAVLLVCAMGAVIGGHSGPLTLAGRFMT